MKLLIGMTDYIFEVGNRFETTHEKNLVDIYNYAMFLKQPLTLGMFVPCDEDGNVLKEPKYDEIDKYCKKENCDCLNDNEIENYPCRYLKYQQAKERCLFDGFHIIGQEENLFELELFGKDFWITFINGKCQIEEDFEIEYIEHLLLNCIEEIQLTQTALKQIGL